MNLEMYTSSWEVVSGNGAVEGERLPKGEQILLGMYGENERAENVLRLGRGSA
jgi:hypothetical protein